MTLVIIANVHRFENQHDAVLLCNRRGALEHLDHLRVHVFVRHALDIVSRNDRHHRCANLFGIHA